MRAQRPFSPGRSAISPARRVEHRRAAGLARSGHARGAPEQLLRGPDEPGVFRPVAAAETLVEGVHARVAQHGGGFRIGHVEGARGRTGFEQILDDAGQESVGWVARQACVGGLAWRGCVGGLAWRGCVVEQDLVQVMQILVALEAGLELSH